MDRRFWAILGVSLLFALVISSVFYQMMARAGSPKIGEIADLRDVIVAARPPSVGMTIKPADIKLAKMPAVAFPKGAFAKAEEVLDRPVISNVLMDEPARGTRKRHRLSTHDPSGNAGGDRSRERRDGNLGIRSAGYASGRAG